MDSDMDEDMEDIFDGAFHEVDGEIDFDYEYDASKYFDFSREESVLETREAESWFSSAPTYPPSPLVLKLSLGGMVSVENVNTSPKLKVAERSDTADMHLDTEMNNSSEMDGNCRGLTFYNHMAQDVRHPKPKHPMKTTSSKGSTLMKPTASQLAKQTQREIYASSRFWERSQTSLHKQNQKSLENPVVESQASKRQKLEGGHLLKAVDTKQHTNFIHKTSRKGGPADGSTMQTKMKLTIPRQPDLETAHRAQRIRPKNSTELGEQVKSTASSMFRARPLNRKILEGPSLPLSKKSTPRLPEFQEFHLKTSERAIQHSSTLLHSNKSDKVGGTTQTSSTIQCGTSNSTRPSFVDTSDQEGCETTHKFKARPLNRKIFSSKGDIGVFRNTKREATVPMEFNFSTDKRTQPHPPVDLFNKLSLTSELQSQSKLPRRTCLPSKGSKENTDNTFHQQQRTMHVTKDKSQRFGAKQFHCGVDRESSEIGSRANTRSLDIR